MKIYLASPFFNELERNNVERMAKILREHGHEVYVPMEHEIENAWDLPNNIWASKVFKEDVKAINNSDVVVALTYGMTDDAGTAWEIGYSYGINKPVKVVAMNKTTYSLMVYQSAVGCLDKLGNEIEIEQFLQS